MTGRAVARAALVFLLLSVFPLPASASISSRPGADVSMPRSSEALEGEENLIAPPDPPFRLFEDELSEAVSLRFRLSSSFAAASAGSVYGTYDHLGTPRLITDTSGTTLDLIKYWPYGEEAGASPTTPQRLRFAGMERDTEGKRYYAHARSHDFDSVGRFLSVDLLGGSPEDPQSWNRYAYVLGNPLNLVDPFGLAPDRFDLALVYDCRLTGECLSSDPVLYPFAGSSGYFSDSVFVPTGTLASEGFGQVLGSASDIGDSSAGAATGVLGSLGTTAPGQGSASLASGSGFSGSVKFSLYSGIGGSLTIGRSKGQWFVRGAFGFGLGGGIEYDPWGGFPRAYATDRSQRVFAGTSVGAGARIGPLSAGVSGEAGLLFYDLAGQTRVKYHSKLAPKVTMKAKQGFGFGVGAALNPFDIGLTLR